MRSGESTYRVTLEIRRGEEKRTHQFTLGERKTITLGRGDCDLPIGDPAVSRRHLGLGVSRGRLFAGDLASQGGTLRNGKRIHRSPAKMGDEFRIGDTRVRIRAFTREGQRPAPAWVRRAAFAAGLTFGLLAFFVPRGDVPNFGATEGAVGASVADQLREWKFWVQFQFARFRDPAAAEKTDHEYIFSR